MVKRISKKARKRLIILAPITIAAILVFLITTISFLVDVAKLKVRKEELLDELSTLEVEEKDLKTEIEKLKDTNYIIKYANENYLFTSSNGEIVFKMDEVKEIVEIDKTIRSYETYLIPVIITGCLIFILIVVKAVKRKKKG